MLATPTNSGGAKEPTLNELLTHATLLLAAILEKLPRTDGTDRVMANISEVSGSITTVSTVSTISALGALVRPTDAIPMHLSNAGSMHIYNHISVS